MSKKYHLSKPDNRGERLQHFQGENSPRWVGDAITYSGIHKWIVRELGKPNLCKNCGTTDAKRFEWANVSGKYKRELKDWIRLCTKCHKAYDVTAKKVWETRRKNGTVKWGVKN